MRKKIIAVVLSLAMVSNTASAVTLNKAQKGRAETITSICIDKYEQYGVLPSVCIAQGIQETNLGKAYNNNNLWGISSNGYAGFRSLEYGTEVYLKTINNGHYEGAPFETDFNKQIKAILAGGYCQPVGSYYNDVCWIYEHYKLEKYDNRLWKAQAKKERAKNQKGWFVVKYNKDIPEHCARVSSKVAEKGTVQLWKNKELQGIWDVQKSDDVNVGVIELNYPELNTKKVHIKVNEEAKG